MINLKEAENKFSAEKPDVKEVCGLGRSLCQEFAEARKMIEELTDCPYEQALDYYRKLQAQKAEGENGEGGG